MKKDYEMPTLTLIGEADAVVLGVLGSSGDFESQAAPDFEFEQD